MNAFNTSDPERLAVELADAQVRSRAWGAGWRRGFAEGIAVAVAAVGLWLALTR